MSTVGLGVSVCVGVEVVVGVEVGVPVGCVVSDAVGCGVEVPVAVGVWGLFNNSEVTLHPVVRADRYSRGCQEISPAKLPTLFSLFQSINFRFFSRIVFIIVHITTSVSMSFYYT